MDNAFGENKIAAFLSVEGGAVLGGDIDVIDALYEKGVRILTLTWNGQNELGDGCFTENAKGLSPFGVNCVKKLQKKGIIVDVSHLSERGFYDVAEYSENLLLQPIRIVILLIIRLPKNAILQTLRLELLQSKRV